MKRLVSGTLGTQEMFELEPRLTISREYDLDEAETMAIHRRRRIGELALTERTNGFRRAVSDLWIPHSQSENMAVTTHPDRYIKQSADLIKEKVFEKYTDDKGTSTVAIARVAIWAQFASNNQQRALATKYDNWREDARRKFLDLNPGLTFAGNVSRKNVMDFPAATQSIATYLADLKSFIGHPDTLRGTNRRAWMQDRYVKKQAEHLAWAKAFLTTQPNWEFDRWYAESWYNHRSRAKFWYDVIHTSYQMREDILVQRRIDTWRADMRHRGYDV